MIESNCIFSDETEGYEFYITWPAMKCPSFSDFLFCFSTVGPQVQKYVTNTGRQKRDVF